MNLNDFESRAERLIELGNEVVGTRQQSDYGGDYVEGQVFSEFRTASLSFLRSTFGLDHPYYTDFDDKVDASDVAETQKGIGILKAARNEIAGGWTKTVKGLVAAEIFSDFLEMAGYLLSEGYKDAAAVMTGSVLEEHLRQLCRGNGIDVERTSGGKVVPRKADILNADLAKAGVYGKLEQKQTTAWLDLRNKAAHGHYADYTREQVDLMHQGVLDFVVRFQV